MDTGICHFPHKTGHNLGPRQVLEYFSDWNLNDSQIDYLLTHFRRYAFLLKEIDLCISRRSLSQQEGISLLDIGPSFQTELIQHEFHEFITINTLGFAEGEELTQRSYKDEYIAQHFHYDLNDCHYKEKRPTIYEHDIVVVSEVIEHLYTDPISVLGFLKSITKSNGYIIIQTPNAVSIDKRMKMLFGYNPFERIRRGFWGGADGHYREYTLNELITIGKEVGLLANRIVLENYFRNGYSEMFFRVVTKYMKTLRQGITIVFLKG